MPAAPGPTSIALAIAAVVAVVPFVGIAVLNLVVAWRKGPPLTQLVENYLRRYPFFAAALSGFFGALVGHVFWSDGTSRRADPAQLAQVLAALVIAVAAGLLASVLLPLIALLVRAVASRIRAG